MRPLPFIMTNDSLQVSFPGEPLTINEDHPHFNDARQLINKVGGRLSDPTVIDELRALMSLRAALERWSGGGFEIGEGKATYLGAPVPMVLHKRIIQHFEEGSSGWVAFANFWARLKRNPSRQAVQELPSFMMRNNIPLDEDGYIYCYKGLRPNYKDTHSGRFRSKPGDHNSMDRNEVSDNSSSPCDHGFHVGDYAFADSYGKRVIVRVDPMDVVRVPSGGKMGVCQYWSIGEATRKPLPSAVWSPGNDACCAGYVKPDKVYLSYNVTLERVGGRENAHEYDFGKEKERVAKVLQGELKFSEPVALAMVNSTPTSIALGMEAQAAKALADKLSQATGEYRDELGGGQFGTKVLIEGVPSVAIDPLADELKTVAQVEARNPALSEYRKDRQPPPLSAKKPAPRALVAPTRAPAGAVNLGPTTEETTSPPAVPTKKLDLKPTDSRKALPVDQRPDLSALNRAKMREFVRNHFGIITGSSKWGVTKLCSYVQDAWAREDAERGVNALEEGSDLEVEVFIVSFAERHHDDVISLLETDFGFNWDDDDHNVDEVLDGEVSVFVGTEEQALEVMAKLEVEQVNYRTVPPLQVVKELQDEKQAEPVAEEPAPEEEPVELELDGEHVQELPDIDNMNRAALRVYVRENMPFKGSSKLGVTALRAHIRAKWDEMEAVPGATAEQPPAVQEMIEDAAEAEEVVGSDELEDHAADLRKATMGTGEQFDVMLNSHASNRKIAAAVDYSSKGRAELRGLAKAHKVSFTSKLGAVHLRKLLSGIDSGKLDVGELQAAKHPVGELRTLLDSI